MPIKETTLSLKDRLRAALKAADFGAVKGARIRIKETEDGYLHGRIYSPLFTGVDSTLRHTAIRKAHKGKFNKADNERILTLFTGAPADCSE